MKARKARLDLRKSKQAMADEGPEEEVKTIGENEPMETQPPGTAADILISTVNCSQEKPESESARDSKRNSEDTQIRIKRTQSEIESIDDLYERFNQSYYHSLDSLFEDMKLLVQKTIDTRCQNLLA